MKRVCVLSVYFVYFFLFIFCSCSGDHYYKGNMHTHTLWSDGDDFPENVTRWYRDNGYNFLVLTDHNIIQQGDEKWKTMAGAHAALLKSGSNVDKRPDEKEPGSFNVRLKRLEEFAPEYERSGKFVLIPGNEISCSGAVHLTSFWQEKALPAPKGTEADRARMIREAVELVGDYSKSSGRNTWPALAHPNFRWAITAEMILECPDLRFFEVFNGHSQVNNNGDKYRAGTDRIWDIVLANRLVHENGTLLYGLAVDDSHNYHAGTSYGGNGPGKGWIMVHAKKLSSESILDALDKGDFYASTGVKIRKIHANGRSISVEIDQQDGDNYLTEYIGTRKGFESKSYPALDSTGAVIPNTTRVYSADIGEILASSNSLKTSYTFKGDELYVRVRVTSSADQTDPLSGKALGKQKAWIQPVVPEKN